MRQKIGAAPAGWQPSARAESPAGTKKPAYISAFPAGAGIVAVKPGGGMVRIPARPCCFVKEGELPAERARELRNSRGVSGMRRDGPWIRIESPDTDYRDRIVSWLEKEAGINTYEGDLSSVQRWLLDDEPALAQPRSVYLDIEDDSRVPFSKKKDSTRVLCWTLCDFLSGETVATGLLDEDTDADERRMLQELWTALAPYDQVLAWNGDRFDFPIIISRSAKLGCHFQPRRWLWLDHLELFRRMNMMSAESGEEKQSMALEAVAQAVLKRGKIAFDSSKTWEAWSNTAYCETEDCLACRRCLLKYCSHDARLEYEIEVETGYVALLQTVCDATGIFADSRAVNPQSQVESFLMRLGKTRGIKPRTRFIRGPGGQREEFVRPDAFRGALVLEPREKGILRDVMVCDFAAMYPSIILSWNISPETKREPLPDPNRGRPLYLPRVPFSHLDACPPGCAATATGTMFEQGAPGILPIAIAELVRLRKYWRDLADSLPAGSEEQKHAKRMSNAYKITGNSFFGVVSSPMSRFFDREVGEAITLTGAWLLENVIAFAELAGLRVVYGDTDSAYVRGCSHDEFVRFVERCNAELFPRLLAERRTSRNHIVLEYEKSFDRLVFVTAKRYAGKFLRTKNQIVKADAKPEIKGLEYKRGDALKLARDMQLEAIKLVLAEDASEEAAQALVDRWCNRVRDEPLELAEVVQSKRLAQSLSSYKTRVKKDGTAGADPPHVAMARLLHKRGRDVGEGAKIDYFVLDGAAKPKRYAPAEDWKGEVDRHEVWETLVYPPTRRLFESAFPGGGWSRWDRTRPAKAKGAPKGPEQTTFAAKKPVRPKAPAEPKPGQGSLW